MAKKKKKSCVAFFPDYEKSIAMFNRMTGADNYANAETDGGNAEGGIAEENTSNENKLKSRKDLPKMGNKKVVNINERLRNADMDSYNEYDLSNRYIVLGLDESKKKEFAKFLADNENADAEAISAYISENFEPKFVGYVTEKFSYSSDEYILTTVGDMIEGGIGNMSDAEINDDIRLYSKISKQFAEKPKMEDIAVLVTSTEYDPKEWYRSGWTKTNFGGKYSNIDKYTINENGLDFIREEKNDRVFIYFANDEYAEDYVNYIDNLQERIANGELTEGTKAHKVKRAVYGDHRGIIKTFAIITAENPVFENGKRIPDEDKDNSSETNNRRMKRLLGELKSMRLEYTRIGGMYGARERSLVVYNPSLTEILEIANEYGQESFFFGRQYEDEDGRYSTISYYATDNGKTYAKVEESRRIDNKQDFDDFFSKVGDFKFSIYMDVFNDDLEPVYSMTMLEGSVEDKCTPRQRRERRILCHKDIDWGKSGDEPQPLPRAKVTVKNEDYDWYDDDDDDEETGYEFVRSKEVYDSNGFLTEYTWYRRKSDGLNVFVFGDRDLYRPEDGGWDYETEGEENAWDWYSNYNGFSDED